MEKLGRRLRKDEATPQDMRLLAEYRRSFLTPYREVIARIASVTPLVPSGRPAKSTASIVSKLQRQTGTLPQMQDIAGCRLVVEGVAEQNSLIASLAGEFSDAEIVDRRAKPSFGYRAVHLIVDSAGRPIEIQVRTRLQDLWAQCSEELAFSVDPAIKYGGGPAQLVTLLGSSSKLVGEIEDANESISNFANAVALARRVGKLDSNRIEGCELQIAAMKSELSEYTLTLRDALMKLSNSASKRS